MSIAVAIGAVVAGLALLVWSADRFVEGAAGTARFFGMSPLLIGMVIVGFGTSAPEMLVSSLAAWQGNAGIALGNAYGSNIANIALILGVTALISPLTVRSGVLRVELPVLTAVTAVAGWQVRDGMVSRLDAGVLLGLFALFMVWSVRRGAGGGPDTLGAEVEKELAEPAETVKRAVARLVTGLLLLLVSSRVLVAGAVEIARFLGVGDLLIGLTIVAVGTSLPELASSVAAVRKGEHDIALGNVLGSNIFNTLAVVGLAGSIRPLSAERAVFSRDIMVMGTLTLSLFVIGYGFRGPGRINRFEGALLLASFAGYTAVLVFSAFGG